METLKILLTNTFYPPYHVGGDATHVQQLATLLAKEGHEVHVAFSIDAFVAKHFRSRKKIIRVYENKDMIVTHPLTSPVSFFEPIFSYSIGYSKWITKKLKKLMKALKPEVIHHHNYSLLGNKIFELNRFTDLSLLTLHDYYPICQQNALFKYRRRLCDSPECFKCSFLIKRPYQFWRHTSINSLILNNDFIISPSMFLRNTILKRSRFQRKLKEKFKVIPNFLNPITFDSHNEYKEVSSEYFVFSGKITYIKGVHKLLKSFLRFSKEVPDIYLKIIGTGNLLKRFRSIVGNQKIDNKIQFLGKLEYKKNLQIIKSAKAFILPSIWVENCPMTLIEAIYLKTIPIATNLGGMKEIVSKLDDNLLINTTSFEKSLSEIMKAVVNKEIRISNFDFEKIYSQNYSTKAFLKEYNRLLRCND